MEIGAGDAFTGLDLEPEHAAVVELENEVDFEACAGAPMPEHRGCILPGGLLAQLADGEGFDEVAELRVRRGVTGGESVLADAHQASCDA